MCKIDYILVELAYMYKFPQYSTLAKKKHYFVFIYLHFLMCYTSCEIFNGFLGDWLTCYKFFCMINENPSQL